MNRAVPLIAGVLVVGLVALASGYGYHRDELYFVAAGHRLAWGYADQGPLTPLVARAMSELGTGSLRVLRLPSAGAAGLVVLLTGRLALELGGGRRAQVLAAACGAAATVVLFTGHLLSTSTFDLLAWTAVTCLAVRAVRTADERLWLLVGVVLGVGLLNKPLPAFLAVGMIAGVAIAGPRRLLRSRYVWGGAVIALALWLPWLIWQSERGWPQLDVARSIAGGGSTSSQPWWAVVPFQTLLVSPPLAPVWICGLVALFRRPEARAYRFLGWTWVVLAVVFMVSAGKPYYLAGLLPLLIASGAVCVDAWLDRGRSDVRRRVLVFAIAASVCVDATIALPVLPADQAGPVIAANADVGETIGWPAFARTVAGVWRTLPPSASRTVIFAENYGEAGAIDRYGPDLHLPRVYSGHNAYGDWGPPPDRNVPVIVVGLSPQALVAHFRGCRPTARIDNHQGVDNDEQGTLVALCRSPRHPWSREWPRLRHLG